MNSFDASEASYENTSRSIGSGSFEAGQSKEDDVTSIFNRVLSDEGSVSSEFQKDPQKMRSLIRVQAIIRGWYLRRRFTGVSKRKVDIFHELQKDQHSLVEMMNLLQTQYVQPLRTQRFKGVPQNEVEGVFNEIQFIVSLHKELLETLDAVERDNYPFFDGVGAFVSVLTKNFQQYGLYLENVLVLKAKLDSFQSRSNDFDKLLSEIFCNLGEQESMADMVEIAGSKNQYYYQKLTELRDCTPAACPDYTALTEAIRQMEMINNFGRNCQLKARNMKYLLEFKNKVGGYSKQFVEKPERTYITELVVFAGEKKKKEKRIVTVLSDGLVVCKEKKANKYSIEEVIPSDAIGGYDTDKSCIPEQHIVTYSTSKRLVFYVNDTRQEKNIPLLSRFISRCSKQKINIFGSSLDALAKADGENGVPRFVISMLQYLISFADIPGMFQKACNEEELGSLRKQIETNQQSANLSASNCHCAAELFKVFLSELNPGVIPKELADETISLDGIESIFFNFNSFYLYLFICLFHFHFHFHFCLFIYISSFFLLSFSFFFLFFSL